MKKLFLLAFAMVTLGVMNLYAQLDAADWERAKAFTMEYLEAMPADKYDFKPTPEIRSFAEQMLHLTDANYGFTAAIMGMQPKYEQGYHEKMEDKSKAKVMEAVGAGYDYVIDAVKKANAAQMGEMITLFGRFEVSRGKAFEKAFEHQTHHRGQTTAYLRLAGVTPPPEKLF